MSKFSFRLYQFTIDSSFFRQRKKNERKKIENKMKNSKDTIPITIIDCLIPRVTGEGQITVSFTWKSGRMRSLCFGDLHATVEK